MGCVWFFLQHTDQLFAFNRDNEKTASGDVTWFYQSGDDLLLTEAMGRYITEPESLCSRWSSFVDP